MNQTPISASITRRGLLVAGAGGAVVASLAGPSSVLAKGKRFVTRTHLRRSSYTPLVGTDFQLRGGALYKTPLRLVEISNLAYPAKPTVNVQEKAFYLTFDGPIGAPLAAGSYRASHPDLGKFDLAISDGWPAGSAWRYVATFNNVKVGPVRKRRKPKATKSKRQRGEHSKARAHRKAAKKHAKAKPAPKPAPSTAPPSGTTGPTGPAEPTATG
jgi:hypothetical protein